MPSSPASGQPNVVSVPIDSVAFMQAVRWVLVAEQMIFELTAKDSLIATQSRDIAFLRASVERQTEQLDSSLDRLQEINGLSRTYERRLRQKIRWQRLKIIGSGVGALAAGVAIGRLVPF